MITAVDTSVLIDIFGADREFGTASANLVRKCLAEGALVACEVVWAETAVIFEKEREFVQAMETLGASFSPLERESALAAARAWRQYRSRGGKRNRVAADFLVGAHALHQAERLLTRDQGFYRDYFSRLRVLDPTAKKS